MTGTEAAAPATAWSSAVPMGAMGAHVAGSVLAGASAMVATTGPARRPCPEPGIGSPTVSEAGTLATSTAIRPTTPVECGASAILAAGGPAAVPFQLCCALTIIQAGGQYPVPLECGAVESAPVGFDALEDSEAQAPVPEPTR
jgi:hypothetical protein